MRQHLTLLGIVLLAALTTASCAAGSPKTATPAASSSSSVSAEQTLGGGSKKIGAYTVTLYRSRIPPDLCNNALQALIVDANNQPVNDATVSFDMDMTNMSHGKNVVTAKLADNGRYAASLSFVMSGPWRVIVVIQRAGQPPASDRFNFSVNLR